MCRVLQVNRSTYYYESKKKRDESAITIVIVDIFRSSRNNYETRKIKNNLAAMDMTASHRWIGRILKQEGMFSNYTKAQFLSQKDICNESGMQIVDRKFNGRLLDTVPEKIKHLH